MSVRKGWFIGCPCFLCGPGPLCQGLGCGGPASRLCPLPCAAIVGREGGGYQLSERQTVMRHRVGFRNRSRMLYLALAKAMSFCRLSFNSLDRGGGKYGQSDQGTRKKGQSPHLTSMLSFSPSSFLPLKVATRRSVCRAFENFPESTNQRMDSGTHLWAVRVLWLLPELPESLEESRGGGLEAGVPLCRFYGVRVGPLSWVV